MPVKPKEAERKPAPPIIIQKADGSQVRLQVTHSGATTTTTVVKNGNNINTGKT